MTRRRATILLHWLVFFSALVIALRGVEWASAAVFVVSGTAMTGIAVARGLMTRASPALDGVMASLHGWGHWAMYAALTLVAFYVALAALARPLPGPDAAYLATLLVYLSALHATYHLWRHTALGDGALRRIFPRALHRLL